MAVILRFNRFTVHT